MYYGLKIILLLFFLTFDFGQSNKQTLVLDTDPKEQLFTACQNGDKTELSLALNGGADVNSKDMADITALHYAAQKGHASIARMLISDGAHVDAVTIDKTTPLMLAVEYEHEKVVRLLLRKGANVDLVDKSGADALHRACFISGEDSLEILRQVLEQSTKHVNLMDNDGKTPLLLALERQNWDVFPLLLRSGAEADLRANSTHPTLLMLAALHGHVGTVQVLLDAGANVHKMDDQWRGVLTYASFGSKRNTQRQGNGVDYNATLETLLFHGAIYDEVKIRMVSMLATVLIATIVTVYFCTKNSQPSDLQTEKDNHKKRSDDADKNDDNKDDKDEDEEEE